jgi:transposase
LIKPDVKNESLIRLKRYFLTFRCGRRLSLNPPLALHEINVLERYKAKNHKKYSRKAVVILMANHGCTLLETMEASHTTSRTIYRWLREFKSERLKSIETRVNCPARQKAQEEQLTRVIDIIHKSPSLYGINRTTWTYGAISQAYLKEFGQDLSSDALKRIIKKTGYSWITPEKY